MSDPVILLLSLPQSTNRGYIIGSRISRPLVSICRGELSRTIFANQTSPLPPCLNLTSTRVFITINQNKPHSPSLPLKLVINISYSPRLLTEHFNDKDNSSVVICCTSLQLSPARLKYSYLDIKDSISAGKIPQIISTAPPPPPPPPNSPLLLFYPSSASIPTCLVHCPRILNHR